MYRKIASRIAASHIRTAGTIEFKKDTGPVRRDIRVRGFEWSPESLRNLAKILWAAQRSHSYALAAYRLFSKLPSAQISPDGLLGGLGYIQSIKDMRTTMSQASEALSSFTDTIHDEINADHWSGTQGEEGISDIVQSAEGVKADPEKFVESEYQEDEGEEFSTENPDPNDFNPSVESDEESDEDEEGETQTQTQLASKKPEKKAVAKLPTDESEQKQGKTESELTMHTVSPDHGSYASSINRIIHAHSNRIATSSLPVDTLPGPRVNHIGPAEGTEAGHFNYEDVWPSDDPMGEGFYAIDPIYEDYNMDGVTPYSDPTDGDETSLKISSNYSWLPGCSNDKPMNYYDLNITEADIDWMKAHNQPDMPAGILPPKKEFNIKSLWDLKI